MCDGVVVLKDWDADGFGHYIIMKDSTTNMGFLYAHMREESPLNVGDTISIGDYVGHEGTTGHSTGIHLHLELQDLTNHNWIFGADKSVYSNPAEFLGIPNQQGISVIYNGTPKPPTPPTPTKDTKNKWRRLFMQKFNITY